MGSCYVLTENALTVLLNWRVIALVFAISQGEIRSSMLIIDSMLIINKI